MFVHVTKFALLLAGISYLSSCAATEEKQNGRDNRAICEGRCLSKTEAVGQIYCAAKVGGKIERGYTTATLVGDRSTILTAGHFLDLNEAGAESKFEIENCIFRTKLGNGQVEARRLILKQSFYKEDLPRSFQGWFDWALVRLDSPLPENVSPIGIEQRTTEELSKIETATLVGFHVDRAKDGKLISEDCKPQAIDKRWVRHQCSTEGGASGALLLTGFVDKPIGLAMHIGKENGTSPLAIIFPNELLLFLDLMNEHSATCTSGLESCNAKLIEKLKPPERPGGVTVKIMDN